MLNLNITIDISERLEAALSALVRTIQCVDIQTAPAPIPEPIVYSVDIPDAHTACAAPEPTSEPEAPVIQPAIEVVETPANDDAPATEPTPEKPKKKKAPKKPVEAPETAPEPEVPVTQSEPEPAATAPTVPQEAAKSDSDPMAGMTVVEAMNALVNEIQAKGVDMAAVNSRVRAKAGELGLTYSSAACLIKAIGYVETRKVALGEK